MEIGTHMSHKVALLVWPAGDRSVVCAVYPAMPSTNEGCSAFFCETHMHALHFLRHRAQALQCASRFVPPVFLVQVLLCRPRARRPRSPLLLALPLAAGRPFYSCVQEGMFGPEHDCGCAASGIYLDGDCL